MTTLHEADPALEPCMDKLRNVFLSDDLEVCPTGNTDLEDGIIGCEHAQETVQSNRRQARARRQI